MEDPIYVETWNALGALATPIAWGDVYLALQQGMVPILVPAARSFGVDLIHLGLVMMCTLSLGHFTPPVGLCLYIGSSISGIPISGLVRPVMPFLVAMIAVCVLLAVFPQLVLFLPRFFFG